MPTSTGPQNEMDWPCEQNWQVVVHDNVIIIYYDII
jgi:hypothetical protein